MGALALDTGWGWGGTRLDSCPPRRHTTVHNSAPENESSFQLLLRARTGDREAQDRLCAHYLPCLHRWARGRLPQNARGALDTSDIVEEVLLHALKHLATFEPQHEWSFQAYLRQSLINRIRDEARRSRRRPAADPLDSAYPSPEPSPLEQAIGVEGLERYEAALKRLRPTEQQSIVARCEWGMSHQEVAELLGKPTAAAAQVAVHRALVRLAKEMAHERRRS
jgi:RNA polymerase sigma factor (sigma-70 family)